VCISEAKIKKQTFMHCNNQKIFLQHHNGLCMTSRQTLKQICICKVETFNVRHHSLCLLCRFLALALCCRHRFTFLHLGRLCTISRVFWFWRFFTKRSSTNHCRIYSSNVNSLIPYLQFSWHENINKSIYRHINIQAFHFITSVLITNVSAT